MEGWSRKEKGLIDLDNSVVTEGDVIREINGNKKSN